MTDDGLTKTDLAVLQFFADYRGVVPLARETVARKLGIDEITAANSILKLERCGYIQKAPVEH